MPYIAQIDREKFERFNLKEIGRVCQSSGELNFVITNIILGFLESQRKSYNTYNSILGVLTSIIQEIYRRLVGPYEDQKISENGDIF